MIRNECDEDDENDHKVHSRVATLINNNRMININGFICMLGNSVHKNSEGSWEWITGGAGGITTPECTCMQ